MINLVNHSIQTSIVFDNYRTTSLIPNNQTVIHVVQELSYKLSII